MHIRSTLAFTICAGLIAACGGGTEQSIDAPSSVPDISGWYSVTSALAGSCGSPTTDTLARPFVYVERLQNTFYVRGCAATMDLASCTGTLTYDLTTPIAGGVAGEGGSAFFSAGCTLSYEHSTAVLTGATLTVHTKVFGVLGDTTITQPQCTLAKAQALTGPCTSERTLTLAKS